MNKTEANTLRKELQAAIEPILESHGLKLTGANAKFDDSSFNMSIKSSDPDAPLTSWELTSTGLPPDLKRGLRFDWNGKRWEFVGVNLRAKKFVIRAIDCDISGKEYRLPRIAATAITEAHEKISQ